MTTRVLITQPVASPYRTDLFSALARVEDVKLLVLYERFDEPNRRQWSVGTPKGYSYAALNSRRLFVRGYESPFYISSPLKVKSFLKWEPDVCLVGGWDVLTNWILISACRRKGTPVLQWIESSENTINRGSKPLMALRHIFLSRAVGFCVPGQDAKAFVQTRFREKPVFVIPNSPARIFTDLREHQPPLEKVALFLGAFTERKGVDLLIRAVDILAAHGWKLRMVGHGALEERVRRLSREHANVVSTPGFVEGKQLLAEYQSASCLLLPSRSDPWPLAAAEATAVGLPVAFGRSGNAADLCDLNPYSAKIAVSDQKSFNSDLSRFLSRLDTAWPNCFSRTAANPLSPNVIAEEIARACRFVAPASQENESHS